eukprot:TRINITY_DN2024_c0_g1_i1.p3 TRINITY_DN2024_c0_g1~~TRINITY_DN2024_c0_g1_i1.p3  ORF type:complete len:124 (-),score=50.30 TRINITY_DN2024_c0_g1_i1:167-538(-)
MSKARTSVKVHEQPGGRSSMSSIISMENDAPQAQRNQRNRANESSISFGQDAAPAPAPRRPASSNANNNNSMAASNNNANANAVADYRNRNRGSDIFGAAPAANQVPSVRVRQAPGGSSSGIF